MKISACPLPAEVGDKHLRGLRVVAQFRRQGEEQPFCLVRFLTASVGQIVALSTTEVVTLEDLPAVMMQPQPGPGELLNLPEEGLSLEIYLDDIRKQLMTEALERTHGVQTQAAELLGMSFRSFRYYAKKMGLTGVETEDGDEASASLEGA